MRDSIIYNGVTYSTELASGSVVIGESLTASELSIDTLTAEINTEAAVPNIPGAAVEFLRDGVLFRRFYVSSVERTGRSVYRLTAVSEIGLLDNAMHYGGLYNGIGEENSAEAVITDIVGGLFTLEIDHVFSNTAVYGWLPIATRRENLQQVLFAIGGNIRRNANGQMSIVALPDAVSSNIADNRIFMGGSVSYPAASTAVKVTEHSYVPLEDETTLFDGEVIAERIATPNGGTVAGQLITFGEPHHSLRCVGASLVAFGANYAVLSGSANATLYGKPYRHDTKIMLVGDAASDNIATVDSCTLVTLANSNNVAKRVMAYYSGLKNVTQDIVVESERPGDRVTFSDPYGESSEGFIQSMELTFGALLRGKCEFNTGYIPTGIGNTYTDCMTVTSSGRVTLPDAERVRLVLIGGGSGGQGGMAGEDGHQPDGSSTTSTSMTEIVLKSVDSGVWRSPEGDDNYYYWYKQARGAYDAETGGLRVRFSDGPVLLTIPKAYASGYIYREVYENGVRDRTRCYVMNGTGTYEGDPMYLYSILEPQETSVPTSALRKYYTEKTDGGAGGAGGLAGASGKVYQIDLDITPGAAMNVTIGSGGTGGSASGEYGDAGAEGTSGGDTTVTIGGVTITSADGVRLKTGYTNIMDGKKYALPAENGTKGGNGGAYMSHDAGEKGGDAGSFTGGAVGATESYNNYGEQRYAGGSGGGASATANGSKGGDGNASSTSTGTSTTGSGGAGASASKPQTQQNPGSGGHGGHGGGGGGNAGGCYDARQNGKTTLGAAGTGGSGSSGGDGAGGVLLIYYGSAPKAMGAVLDADGNALIGSDGAAIQVSGGYTSMHRGAAIDAFATAVLNG